MAFHGHGFHYPELPGIGQQKWRAKEEVASWPWESGGDCWDWNGLDVPGMRRKSTSVDVVVDSLW